MLLIVFLSFITLLFHIFQLHFDVLLIFIITSLFSPPPLFALFSYAALLPLFDIFQLLLMPFSLLLTIFDTCFDSLMLYADDADIYAFIAAADDAAIDDDAISPIAFFTIFSFRHDISALLSCCRFIF